MYVYLTQAIKDFIEEGQHRASCYLGNVIKGFTSIVPNPTVLVIEARQHWRNKILQIQTSILMKKSIKLKHYSIFCVMLLSTLYGQQCQHLWLEFHILCYDNNIKLEYYITICNSIALLLQLLVTVVI